MGSKAPAFQFYASDWLGSTKISLMTPEQEGAYIRLLAHAWSSPDCSLPGDSRSLGALSRLGPRWESEGPLILECFEREESGRIFNPRLRSIKHQLEHHQQTQRENGEKGAAARWGRHGSANGVANGVAIVSPMATGMANPMAKNSSPSPSPSPTPSPLPEDKSPTSADQQQPQDLPEPETPLDASKPTGTTPDTSEPVCVDSRPVPGLPVTSGKMSNPALEVTRRLVAVWNEGRKAQIRVTPEKIRRIKARLGEGWTEPQMATAIRKMRMSAWHMGKNERGWVADFDFLFRSAGQIEKFLNTEAARQDARAVNERDPYAPPKL